MLASFYTVYDEIQQTASERNNTFGMSLFLLGFSSYQGFEEINRTEAK